MTFIIVFMWSVIGFIAGGVIFTELGPLFGFRHMEGSSAYFGVFTGAPLGLIAGVAFAIWKSRSYVDDTKRRGNFAFFTFLGILGVIAASFGYEAYRTRDDISDGGSKWLNCRFRLPPGVNAPDKTQKITMELRSDKETRKSSPYSVPEWELKGGRFESYSSVEVYKATTNRSIGVTIGEGPTYVFKIGAPARPKTYSYESEWMTPERVDGAGGVGLEAKCGM